MIPDNGQHQLSKAARERERDLLGSVAEFPEAELSTFVPQNWDETVQGRSIRGRQGRVQDGTETVSSVSSR